MARSSRRRPARRRGVRPRRGRRILLRFALGALAAAILATTLPLAVLRFVAPPTTAFMLRSRWADPATGLPCHEVAYRWAEGDAISPHLALAVVVAEDQRFLEHRGIDWEQVGRALRERQRAGRVRGASTIIAVEPAHWRDRPALERLGHELWHCLGAKHGEVY